MSEYSVMLKDSALSERGSTPLKKVAPVQLSAGRERAKSAWLSRPERLTLDNCEGQ